MTLAPGGYLVERFETRRAEVVELWRQKYGPEANTASDTVDGLLIDIITRMAQFCDEQGFVAYSAHFILSAVGLQLDQILAPMFGTKRLPDRGSVAEVVLYGDAGSTVPRGALVSTLERGDIFELQAAEEIEIENLVVFVVGDSDVATDINITINGTNYPVGPLLGISGSGPDIAQYIIDFVLPFSDANIAAVHQFAGVDPNGQGVVVVDLTGPYAVTASSSSGSDIFAHRGERGLVLSQETGPILGNARTIVRINTPVLGWAGVINIEDATLGAAEETDSEYIVRHLRTFSRAATATPMGVRAGLYDLVGVEWVRLYFNLTGADPDAAGRPSHSMEAVVEGGSTEQIAELLWLKHTTGTQTHGQVTAVVVDSRDGTPRQMKFTRAVKLYVWFEIEIERGEGFPTTAIADIQTDVNSRVVDYGRNLGPGFDVYRATVAGVIDLSGVKSLTIRLATSVTPLGPATPLDQDLDIAEIELTRWDASRGTVTVI